MQVVSASGRVMPGRGAAKGDTRRGERGFCALKSLLWLAIMGSFIYVCIQAAPAFVNEYQFQDAMQTLARYASVNRQTADDIRLALLKEAFRDNIPLRPEDIRVTSNSGNVRIEAVYGVTVDLRVYKWTLNFHPSAANNSLT
jgi:hypothetical protein